MDNKKKFYIILLILISTLYIMFQNDFSLLNTKTDYRIIDKNFINDFEIKINNNDTFTQSLIEINNLAGDILVDGSTQKKNIIKVKIRVYHKNKHRAEKIKNLISVSLKNKNNHALINTVYSQEKLFKRVRVIFTIRLSKNSKLIINNAYGLIKATNINTSLNISNKNGSIALSNIDGKIFIKNSDNNNITIKDSSDIIANLFNTSTVINNIKGHIEVFSKEGRIKLKNINSEEKNIRIVSEESDVSLSNINVKYANIKISYADIYVRDSNIVQFDVALKNGNIIFNPIKTGKTKLININGLYSKIILKYNNNISPCYNINLDYGNIKGSINGLCIKKNSYTEKLSSKFGSPTIIIRGNYSDIRIIKLNK